MNNKTRVLFTMISLVFIFIGVLAITTQTHTGYAKYQGMRTLVGADAIWFGQTCILLSLLPLIVWLPKKMVGWSASIWWLSLMAWIFIPFIFHTR